MILQTDKVFLRQFKKTDLDNLFEYAQDEEIGLNAGFLPHQDKEHSAIILNIFINDKNTFAIYHKKDKKVIGSITISKDKLRQSINSKCIGYVLSKKYWGQGIMTDCLKEIIKYCFFTLNIDILSVSHFEENIASKRVIQKNGFVYEGTLRNSFLLYNGRLKNKCIYSLTKNEYITFNKNY